MFRIPFISKTKKTTVNNIVFDPSLKRFCMHDVCNLKYVGKLECLSHKLSFLLLFACDSTWFAWFFVDIYLVALSCLVSVVPNILWLITFDNFRNIETFHVKRQWWRQKFSAAITSVNALLACRTDGVKTGTNWRISAKLSICNIFALFYSLQRKHKDRT